MESFEIKTIHIQEPFQEKNLGYLFGFPIP